jgi:CubicO group peptidase (beta-lactamase class C family)/peptidoglycan/LPS O-acetylase OafA/YrhL
VKISALATGRGTPDRQVSSSTRRDASGRLGARDTFLDAVKALAITRVILWHTWAWWWLSWIAAMPAMFFVSGALLSSSLERNGYSSTLRSRLRRLLLPFWVYSACCVTVMLASGWRPDLHQLLSWVLPFTDPVGSRETAGLWIPLWYLRAYLWFLLAAPFLRRAVLSLGHAVLVAPTAATLGLWFLERQGAHIPISVSDAAAYSFFVLAGMLYQRRGKPRPLLVLAVGTVASFAAIAWWANFGPSSKIVNASYPLQILTGCVFVAFLLAAPAIGRLSGRPQRLIRLLGSKALSIYLWQGFGLLAADRLVTRQGIDGTAGAAASILVVAVVTAACVWAFGWVEDVAAHRPAQPPRLRFVPVAAAATVCFVLAAALRPATDSVGRLPPSGQAVIARGGLVNEQVHNSARPERRHNSASSQRGRSSRSNDPAVRVQGTLDAWVDRNRDTLRSLGTHRIDAIVVAPTGTVIPVGWSAASAPSDAGVLPWWSMSKVVTTAWLSQLVDEGLVSLQDPLSKFVPQAPHSKEITLEHLARHQSGIPTEFDQPLEDASPREELERWFDTPRLEFKPGTGFAYSRIGYYLLAWALEQASGTSWEDTVRSFGGRAGVHLVIDEDLEPMPEPTHPGTGSYRGRLWSSGGILATPDDSARFFRWLMTDGVSRSGRAAMATFSNDKASWYYGLGLLPLCPCQPEGSWVKSTRYGLDSLIGSWAFDEDTTATVFLDPDSWFTDDGPRPEFYELEALLLDASG